MARKYLKWIDAPIWVKIGRNIKHTREWKGASQEQVASKAMIDLKRYRGMERTVVKDITFDEVFRIGRALNLDSYGIENIINY